MTKLEDKRKQSPRFYYFVIRQSASTPCLKKQAKLFLL